MPAQFEALAQVIRSNYPLNTPNNAYLVQVATSCFLSNDVAYT